MRSVSKGRRLLAVRGQTTTWGKGVTMKRQNTMDRFWYTFEGMDLPSASYAIVGYTFGHDTAQARRIAIADAFGKTDCEAQRSEIKTARIHLATR